MSDDGQPPEATAASFQRAVRLEDAQRSATPVTPTADDRVMTLVNGYGVQRLRQGLRTAESGQVAGYKVGLTAAAAQRAFGVGDPISGYLPQDSILHQREIPIDDLIAPKLEVEIAFLLHDQLREVVEMDDPMEAVAAVGLAFEIIDSRWSGTVDTAALLVADNGFAAKAVVGPWIDKHLIDLRDVRVELTVADQRVVGRSSNVIGGPTASLAWLAQHLDSTGEGLQPGRTVLTGTLTSPVRIRPGDVAVADFGPLGALRADFCGQTSGS